VTAAPSNSRAPVPATLRQRLLVHVLLPVLLVWLTSTGIVIQIAMVFTQQAFDRALVDDAYALSAHVRVENGKPTLELSARELAWVLFDQSERVFFAVRAPDGAVVANNAPWMLGDRAATAMAPNDRNALYALSDQFHESMTLRSVDLFPTPEHPWRITIAQTVQSRTKLVQQLLLYAVVPEVLLFLLLGLWLRRAIGSDLAPLGRLRHALQVRDVTDLSPINVDASSRDVVQVTQAANALFDRVREAINAQREFAGNVAHEMRNPLAGIRALADYGLRQTNPEIWRTQLSAILEREGRASHLIDQLLALAFADEARDTVALASVELSVPVEKCVLAALPQIDAGAVELSVQGLDVPLWVRGNENLIVGMLTNLLDNALRYGRPALSASQSIATIVIGVELLPDGDKVAISVTDNGPGMEASVAQDRTRWARGANIEATRGSTGLGLFIVTRYAELLGTALTLENIASGGLKASFLLPTTTSEISASQT
jgi:two-component system, OmpR family, sensor histidine kinase TctE